MKRRKYIACLAFASMIGMVSCQTVAEPETVGRVETGAVEVFAGNENGSDSDGFQSPELVEITNLLDDGFVNNRSIIYLSQLGPTVDPNFTDPSGGNYYTYMYYDNPSAWFGPPNEEGENIGGYNFAPFGQYELDWAKIAEINKIGNGYVFCGLYFPYDNIVRFAVEKDQSELSNLQKSNVLGAKHTTANFESRLRFRFYHLMVYLRVTLYVPVWNETDNSGFLENALKQASILNVGNNFQIKWTSDIGADQLPDCEMVPGSDLTDILMYIYPGSEVTKINVADYYNYPDSDGTETVRKYTVGVLFPAGQDFTNRNFLRFGLDTPGGTRKNYVFSTSQTVGDGTLQFSRGSITSLDLYLPRNGNNTILIKAEVEDWHHSESDMNVYKE